MIRATVVRDPTSKLVSSASDAEEPLSGKSCQSQRPSGFAGRAHAVLLNTGRMAKYGHLLKSPSAGEDGKKKSGPSQLPAERKKLSEKNSSCRV